MDDLIKTQPPGEVFKALKKNFLQTRKQYLVIDDKIREKKIDKIEPIDEAINTHLWAMLNLASLYLPAKSTIYGPSNRRFAANVMIYKKTADVLSMPGDRQLQIKEGLRMTQDEPSFETLIGVLLPEPQLSFVLNDSNSRVLPENGDSGNNLEQIFGKYTDDSLENIVFPIPIVLQSQHNKKRRYLPGAPTAYIDGEDLIGDTHKLLDLFRSEKKYDIAEGVFISGHRHFTEHEKGQRVRSIASIALYASNEDCIGVVNLHCNHKNIFVSEETFGNFKYMITPLLSDMAELVKIRIAASSPG